ncbi:hypothetical protein PMAYCL1PPCAC_14633 [Pristionchus mayeri]|uniref:Uncharacterized protein n=1 Tax=Pristionchus mayeri TaxID=1317129 RepID=A0AAN4ZND4_9BILA|nr:hypothetical protein PMAYCL1PPCAC_14633 [Pristionchus mayeri]
MHCHTFRLIMRASPKVLFGLKVLLLLGVIFLLFDSYFDVRDYAEYRTTMETIIRNEPSPFPAVTFCDVSGHNPLQLKEDGSVEFTSTESVTSPARPPSIYYCSFNKQKCDKFQDIRTKSNCFTFNFNDTMIWRQGLPDPQHGLRLLIDGNNTLRVVVHDQGVMPLPAQFGIFAQGGFSTTFRIKSKFIRRLGQPYGACRDFDLLFSGMKYSQEGAAWMLNSTCTYRRGDTPSRRTACARPPVEKALMR